MTKLATIGAVCVAAVLAVATPAMARGGMAGHGGMHGGHAAFSGGHGGPAHFAGGGRFGHRGFGPGIAAGVVAGAALGGLGYYNGYYGDSYAYDDGGYAPAPYYSNNQFVCQPGTYFVGEDGLRHLCQ